MLSNARYVAAILVALFAVSSPISAHAAEPAWLSVGLSTHYVSWELESDREGDTTNSYESYGLGVEVAVDLHPLVYLQGELATPYSVIGQVNRPSQPDSLTFGGLQFAGGNLLALSRPFGHTAISPTVGVGLAYRHLSGGDYVPTGADESASIDRLLIDHQFQGIAAAGVSWNSGWRTGSIHIDAQARVFGPPSGLAAETDDSNPFEPLKSWAWQIWLGCRLSVL